MSTRERWIVYPLLFLTLGAVLRDKLVGSREVRAERVVCERLESIQAECGRLVVVGANGRPVILAGTDSQSHGGAIATFSPTGFPLVQIDSSPSGGTVVLSGVGQGFGVFAQSPKQGMVPIALPHWPETKTSGKATDKKAGATPGAVKQQPGKTQNSGDGAKDATNNKKAGEKRTSGPSNP
ncbi:MAG: hypothetical protein LLG00_05915 [Planctomycetaceae bacterium]|nr:hypothetical protein [Planctomycetaceae bacterium]